MDEIRGQYAENTRFRHSFGDIGPEAWKVLSMQTFFPDVKLSTAALKRAQAAISATSQPSAPSVPPPGVLTDVSYLIAHDMSHSAQYCARK
jgi:hypothetical protein